MACVTDVIWPAKVLRVVAELREIRNDSSRLQRLAEIEQMILSDLVDNPKPFNCPRCLHWAEALIAKANKN